MGEGVQWLALGLLAGKTDQEGEAYLCIHRIDKP
jgi:hypothetical protein